MTLTVRPDIYKKYEYANYKKALERGVGLCSQRANIVVGILSENKINANIIGLNGHVVLRAEDENGKWYVLDPDYGVVIPYDIYEIQNNLGLLKEYYTDEKQHLINMYAGEFSIYPKGPIGIYSYHPNAVKIYYIEYISYLLKWLIPIILIVIVLICQNRAKEHS